MKLVLKCWRGLMSSNSTSYKLSMFPALNKADLLEGDKIAVQVQGKNILVIRLNGIFHAYLDRCCHLGLKLSPGKMERGVLTCPFHHWQYDAETGNGINPKNVKLTCLPVEVRDGRIFVGVEG